MTFYERISAQQVPHDFGVDKSESRAMLSFNVVLTKRPSETVEEEIFGLLKKALPTSVAIVCTSRATVPDGDGPIVTVRVEGGAAPTGTHNEDTPTTHRPGVLITARARRYRDARATAYQAFNALTAVTNRELVPADIP